MVASAETFSVVLARADDDENAARDVPVTDRTEDTLETDAVGAKASTRAEAKRATRAVEVNRILMVKCRWGGGPISKPVPIPGEVEEWTHEKAASEQMAIAVVDAARRREKHPRKMDGWRKDANFCKAAENRRTRLRFREPSVSLGSETWHNFKQVKRGLRVELS